MTTLIKNTTIALRAFICGSHMARKSHKNQVRKEISYTKEFGTLNIDFCDNNDDFTYADLKAIINKEFPGAKPNEIRIYCHSMAGMQLSTEESNSDWKNFDDGDKACEFCGQSLPGED